MRNELTKIKVDISSALSGDQICETLGHSLLNVDNIYSYLVYATYLKGTLDSFLVEIMVNDNEQYNTISQDIAIADIAAQILRQFTAEQQKHVIAYKQPPLSILLQLYEPLVVTLSKQQHQYWQQLEYEDLCQICRLTICNLYNAGYYVHKSLVQRAFSNAVLLSIRKERYTEQPLSLNYKVKHEDEKTEMMNLIPDTSMLEEIQEAQDNEDATRILQEKRDLIIAEVGKRQYDQLVKAYSFGNTDGMSRRIVNKLKNKFIELGITERTFQRYF